MALLPSLADCSAAKGRKTFKPSRTTRDEETDRATSAQLGTFSSHSMILRLASFLEAILAHEERINGKEVAQQRLRREIAKLKMAAASLPSSDGNLPVLAIGHYTEERDSHTQRRQLVVWGARFKGVMAGGVLAKQIVEYVLLQTRGVNGPHGPKGKKVFVVKAKYCIVHDAVFEIAVEASRKLVRSAL